MNDDERERMNRAVRAAYANAIWYAIGAACLLVTLLIFLAGGDVG